MNLTIRQVSSLEKVRSTDNLNLAEMHNKTVMQGERFSYQICLRSDEILQLSAAVESPLADCITLYQVREVPMDAPITEKFDSQEDYITMTPGLMPDLLIPMDETDHLLSIGQKAQSIWVKVNIPKQLQPGTYAIKIKLSLNKNGRKYVGTFYQNMHITVIPAVMPAQKLIYTRWFYADCIAVAHDVEIYSEKHWDLIDKYIAAAADTGINMILVPTHTPPLDTEIGSVRPCVQLVDIEKHGTQYVFRFDKFRRFIDICRKNGINYFEIAHMFSQWGAKCAPNIMITENGKTDYMFGWHVAADSDEYVSFLKQYIAAISDELEKEGISENTYFHISDEPTLNVMNTYKTASEIIRPLIGNSKTFDALSDYAFYEKKLVECPVTGVSHIQEFLEHDIKNQWAYYCGAHQKIFTGSLMAMPSYRTRILGFLLYKYNIKGFLHWGFNFYNAVRSIYPINPYLTTSCDRAYPSGDAFIVYPGKDCVYGSIRGEITYEAIQDMNICFALEEIIGRDAVVQLIDTAAGCDLRFDDYPRNNEFLENLRAEMIEMIRQTAKV